VKLHFFSSVDFKELLGPDLEAPKDFSRNREVSQDFFREKEKERKKTKEKAKKQKKKKKISFFPFTISSIRSKFPKKEE